MFAIVYDSKTSETKGPERGNTGIKEGEDTGKGEAEAVMMFSRGIKVFVEAEKKEEDIAIFVGLCIAISNAIG